LVSQYHSIILNIYFILKTITVKIAITLYTLNSNIIVKLININSYFRSCKISRTLCIDIKDDCPAGMTIIGVLDILCFACWEAVSFAYKLSKLKLYKMVVIIMTIDHCINQIYTIVGIRDYFVKNNSALYFIFLFNQIKQAN